MQLLVVVGVLLLLLLLLLMLLLLGLTTSFRGPKGRLVTGSGTCPVTYRSFIGS